VHLCVVQRVHKVHGRAAEVRRERRVDEQRRAAAVERVEAAYGGGI
jgi:hypothetical protein